MPKELRAIRSSSEDLPSAGIGIWVTTLGESSDVGLSIRNAACVCLYTSLKRPLQGQDEVVESVGHF